MQRFFFATGALLAGLAVAVGAATGHESSTLSKIAGVWLEKAVRYQFLHALGLISIAISLTVWQGQRQLLVAAGWCFLSGILFFSGSLYLMAFTGFSAGYLTPLGGMGFLAGWLAMVLAGLKLSPCR